MSDVICAKSDRTLYHLCMLHVFTTECSPHKNKHEHTSVLAHVEEVHACFDAHAHADSYIW